jgi:hypothetical protein
MGGGGDKDGQNWHIISPSWVLHLPAGYSCIGQGLQQYTEFNIIILWLWKANEGEFFYFPGDTIICGYSEGNCEPIPNIWLVLRPEIWFLPVFSIY